MKKIISTLTLLLIAISNNFMYITYAVNTNEQSTPWTMEKAEHLAKKALYGVTPEKVLELYNAGSAMNAVNILFPSIEGPDKTGYNTKMDLLLNNEWLIETSKSEMREYYTVKKINDPYEAKSKLFGLFEDTFSVNTINKRINYGDIEDTYKILYDHTLGNYKEMIKRNLYNNGVKGDYSLGEYLDLFNQKKPSRPNENYSREIIQLFMMLEYKPTESEDNGNTRNYTEDDVNALAKILFGFEADENTHIVTYNADSNTNTSVEFLDGDLKNGDLFPFYNSGSGIIDITEMKKSINGNNGLPDNTIDYIFSKREEEIAIFLADKLYRFYIAENPSRVDLNMITNEIIENNFEIYPTVKRLLSHSMVYSEKSMNDIIYKNPLELVIGTTKTLGLNTDNLDLRSSLSNIGWTPYGVGKIFGRDGYDDSSVFFTSYIANKWTSESSRFATKLIDTNSGFLDNSTTATGIIEDLENKLYLGKRLDLDTKNKLITYLTTNSSGTGITVDTNDSGYVARNLQGAIYIMLNQPEYILQSGFDKAGSNSDQNETFYKNNNKLVLIKASGGLDWLHAFIPKNEYSEYLELRSTGSVTGTGLIELDSDYYMNSSLEPFKEIFDNGNLKVINRVGTPKHSRGHDSASRKMTSLNNLYSSDEGVFGHFIANEDPGKTIVLAGSSKPSILRNGKFMGIGTSATYQINTGKVGLNAADKNHKINTLKDILKNREYIGIFGEVFKNNALIDDVARDSKANGGREGSGYNMQQKFTFLESMYNAGLGNTAWLRADGGYDTHGGQKPRLNANFKKVAEATANFFNNVKENHNVTIVIYSEFGRTKKLNSSEGVDHGMAGGMFVLSNNQELINVELPNKVYGNLSFKNSKSNWLGVGIDYRSVYSKIYKALYNKDTTSDFKGEYDINNYIENSPSSTQLFWYDHKQYSNNNYNSHIKFNIDDINYFPDQASYIKFEYWSDTNPVKEFSTYNLNRTRVGDKDYDISFRTTGGKKYYYKLTIYDNQYNEKVIERSFITPKNQNELSLTGSTFIPRFKNINLDSKIILNNSSTGIVLSNSGSKEYIGGNNTKMLSSSGTYISEILGGTGTTWNGVFTNPIEIDINNFIGSSGILDSIKLNNFNIVKVIKIGASTLGVGLKLNKNVIIEIKDIDTSKDYAILTSEDGIKWNLLENPNTKKLNNLLTFETSNFSYFAITESDSSGNPININGNDDDSSSNDDNSNGGGDANSGGSSNNGGTQNSSGGGGSSGTPRYKKDVCPYGDFSVSYYDKTCGVDLYLMHAMNQETEVNEHYLDIYDDLKNDLKNIEGSTNNVISNNNSIYKNEKEIELAYIELKIKEEEKAKIYEDLFEIEIENEVIDSDLFNKISQKDILILLREKLSSIYIEGYKLVHIKNSNLNKKFEKIGNLIINKNFSENKTEELFKYLNEVIVYSAIKDLDNLDEKLLEKNINLLKESIQKLVNLYKSKILKITEKNIKLIKKETVREKIIRINKVNSRRKDLLK